MLRFADPIGIFSTLEMQQLPDLLVADELNFFKPQSLQRNRGSLSSNLVLTMSVIVLLDCGAGADEHPVAGHKQSHRFGKSALIYSKT